MDAASAKTDGLPFDEDEIVNWWKAMQPQEEQPGNPNFRGELAELRRCKNLEEVFFVPRFQVFRNIVKPSKHRLSACAAVAGILAHVKINNANPRNFAYWLGQPKAEGGNTPRLSELRFRRLVRAKTHEELFIDLIRTLPLADYTAPVKQLARDVYQWNDFTRREWTFAYYDARAGEEKP